MTAAAPSGVVTFLFTDVEGSTRRWENDAEILHKIDGPVQADIPTDDIEDCDEENV
jgi:hypothetical protein